MKSVSGKKLAEILQKKGWELVRINGSHHRYKRGSESISIPIHANTDLKKGMLRSIMKQAELKEEDLI